MDLSALERQIDSCMVKQALYEDSGVLGPAESTAGAIGQAALYATPFLGSGLSIADGIKDWRNGHFWRGLGNVALGLGTGALDFFSLGTAGTAARGAVAAARGGAAAAKAARGGAVAAKAMKGVNAVRNAATAARTATMASKPVATAARYAGRAADVLDKTWAGRRVVGLGRLGRDVVIGGPGYGAAGFAARGAARGLNSNTVGEWIGDRIDNGIEEQFNNPNSAFNGVMDRMGRNGSYAAPQPSSAPFRFGNSPAAPAVEPAKPRYGYNPQTYRYERLY